MVVRDPGATFGAKEMLDLASEFVAMISFTKTDIELKDFALCRPKEGAEVQLNSVQDEVALCVSSVNIRDP